MSSNEWSPPADDNWTQPNQEPAPTPRPGIALVTIALLVPVFGAIAELFAETFLEGLIVAGASVLISAILVYIDALQIGNIDAKGKKQTAPVIMLIGMFLLWIVYFPWSFVRRSRITSPNLSLFAILSAVIFLIGPLAYSFFVPPSLPACNSKMVKDLLVQIVRGFPIGARMTSIDGHQEISFDIAAQRRLGQCTVHAGKEELILKYVVEWQGNDRTRIYVKTIAELPACDSQEIHQLLEQVLRRAPEYAKLKSLEGLKEISYDKVAERRECQCIIKTEDEESVLNFIIQWRAKDQYTFEIVALPTLPGCKNKAVVQLLHKLIREQSGLIQVTSIDGYQELKYDQQNDQRFGQCTAHTPKGDVLVKYIIQWADKDKKNYLVRLVPANLET